jgi:pilus assembly protein CpaC
MRKIITLAMVAATVALVSPHTAGASDPAEFGADTRYNADTRSIPLGIGKSVVIDLPRDAKDVLVGDPQVANAVVRTARRAYLIGVKVGQTNVFFFDADGKQIAGFDVAVTRDIGALRLTLRAALPQANVRVQAIGDGVLLTGAVANAGEAQQAVDLATRAIGNVGNVVNNLTIKAPDQVMLKVAVVEMQRDIAKQLGVNLSGQFAYGKTNLSFNSSPVGPASDGDRQIGGGWASGGNSVTARLKALETAGVIRTLAEPNLTAISGEAATFLAGGELPYITNSCAASTGGNTQICTPVTSFKPFGVQLAFVPIVLSDGRISLKVGTSVSEISSEGAVTIGGVSVPSLKTRRVETTVELPSGGSMTLAGLLQEQTRNTIQGIPAAAQLPVLGALFRSREYNNRQTELVIIVTPFIVKPTAEKNLSRPDDGFADASDPQAVFLGKVNRVYGPPGKKDPRRQYHGSYGFIMD